MKLVVFDLDDTVINNRDELRFIELIKILIELDIHVALWTANIYGKERMNDFLRLSGFNRNCFVFCWTRDMAPDGIKQEKTIRNHYPNTYSKIILVDDRTNHKFKRLFVVDKF